ncbi:MAG: amino acid adenylation domain-containing protein [Halanaerobiales bacterium]|nr:amino acid adenylation domain-containing protein [Halanaerobiales bacterium]
MNIKEKIKKENIEDILALSPMQEGMFFHYLKDNDTDLYFEQLSINITGRLDFYLFNKTWNIVIDQNAMLRTGFVWEKLERPIQIVLKRLNFSIDKYDFSSLKDGKKNESLKQLKEQDRKKRFDLEKGPLFRVTLCKLEEENFEIIISNHHIIYDGWSNGIILNDFLNIYSLLNKGQHPIQSKKTKFKEYLRWLRVQDKVRQETFWREDLKDFEEKTELPTDQKESDTHDVEKFTYKLPDKLVDQINEFVKQYEITLGVVIYSVWGLLLQRYNNMEEVLFGTTVSGRPAELIDIEKSVGLFINTIPLRVKSSEQEKVLDLLNRINDTLYKRKDFENTPLAQIQSYGEIYSQESLFDSIVVIENYPINQIMSNNSFGLNINSFSTFEKTNYDLTLEVTLFDGLELNLIYNRNSFSEVRIKQLVSYFEKILIEISNDPQQRVSEIEIVTQKEKEKLLFDFNLTDSAYPKDQPLSQLFEEVVENQPDHVALSLENQQLTYRELNQKANQLARVLREKGVQRNTIIGLMVERSCEMIISIFAILKAGGVYLPINPDDPMDRINYILEDSKTNILLTQKTLGESFNEVFNFNGEIIHVDDANIYTYDMSNLENSNISNDLAYVIYTSGTTGKPKGTLVAHFNISRVVKNTNYIEITENDRILQLSNYAFDGSTFDIFAALLNGATLILIRKEDVLDLVRLANIIALEKVTVFFVTTALFNMLVEHQIEALKDVRKILFGGERVSLKHVRKAIAEIGPAHLIHVYGPTESTVFATFYPVEGISENAMTIPIGKPISNTQVYILDQYLNVQPDGFMGELCISGDGLARGYLNQPELTAEKFIPHPFIKGERLYKTGDLVKRLQDGNIEFIGRIDQQIKLRGFRIELAEIELELLKFEEIKEAVVILRENGDFKYLCAYIVTSKFISTHKLREELFKSLPEYMIPAQFMLLERLPLTSNGKIDKKALPKPDQALISTENYLPPTNQTEAKLVKIFSKVLGVKRIGVLDDFFSLGGHSLNAISLTSKIMKEFEVEISLREIFDHPTILQLARIINTLDKSSLLNIEKVPVREYYPLTSAQKGMFILSQHGERNISYNMPGVWMIDGQLDLERFENTIKSLIKRHEAFRTSFKIVDGEPMQKIHPDVDFKINYLKASTEDIDDLLQQFVQPFDLSKPPLLRVGIVQTQEKSYFIYDMHHIISDGLSMYNLINDFAHIYEEKELSELKIQYKDYTVWQNDLLNSDKLSKQENYWIERFTDQISHEVNIPILNLQTDYPRTAIRSFEGDRVSFKLDKKYTDKLKKLAVQNNATLYMLLFATYNLLLSRYTSQEDIVFGTPVQGRWHPDLEKIIGMFVNTLAIRNYVDKDKSFLHFLEITRENLLDAFENQDYPFEKLVEKLDLNVDVSHNPLFDTFFVLQKGDCYQLKIRDIKLTPYAYINQVAKFDLSLEIIENNGELDGHFEYSTKLFKRETIERLAWHYKNILQEILKTPEKKISKIEILSPKEKDLLLYEFNQQNAQNENEAQTLNELFEMEVDKSPDKVALVFGDQQLTYSEFNQKVNQLAHILRKNGVQRESIVAIMVTYSIEMMIGIYGILKAGGAYLPIDPANPKERIQFILEDSNTEILLTQTFLTEKFDFSKRVICLDDKDIYQGNSENVENINSPNDLAYIIYTSGTTGKPKGSLITHFNVNGVLKNLGVTIIAQDRFLHVSNYVFDASVLSLFGFILNGATLIIIPKESIVNLEKLTDIIIDEEVTVLVLSTGLFNIIVDHKLESLKNVRKISFGGESASFKHVKKAFDYLGPDHLINMYGPTECTVASTYYSINKLDTDFYTIPIGKSISNTSIYILDKENNLQPIGISGELCIAGDGVGRGYLNRPELTEEKFVQNPFNLDQRMYRTGDLAKWLPDGNIEFIGRIDHQIKLRGYRIELSEIEKELLTHKMIKDAHLVVKKDLNEDKYICAYLVTEEDISQIELRNYLAKTLPEYMIPAYFITVEKFSLNAIGKIDLKALPEPDLTQNIKDNYLAPTNETEEKLVTIWSEILGIEEIGVRDNFFTLGGQSLKAMSLLSKITVVFNVEISFKEIFNHPTIEELAKLIQSVNKKARLAIEKVEELESYPLSSAQKRMFILNQMDSKSIHYNMPAGLIMEGELDYELFEKALRGCIERHETLRTSFELIDGETVQRIHKDVDFEINYQEGSIEDIDKIFADFVQPFDLAIAPLFRAEFIKLNLKKHLFLLDLHHIIADGISMGILIKDFQELYTRAKIQTNAKLPELKIQYKDFTIWQNNVFNSEMMKEQKEYWLEVFSGDIPILDFPIDYQRPSIKSFAGDSIKFVIDNELLSKLKEFASAHDATLYMVFFSAYNLLLSRYTHQQNIIVGTPIAGRTHPDFLDVIGLFINTLAIRIRVEQNQSLDELLSEVKTQTLSAFDNQDYPFEKLLEEIELKWDMSRNPLFDTFFSFQDGEDLELEIPNLSISPYSFKKNIAKFDFSLDGFERNGEVEFDLEYSTMLFKKETMERFAGHFINILNNCFSSKKKLYEIEMISENEKRELLVDFNNTQMEILDTKMLHQLFEKQAERRGDKTALIFKEERLSYQELNQKANQLARVLREKGVSIDQIVAIMVEPSLEMVIGILAILKAGGAYLPIDPAYPINRIKYMLRDSNTSILFTQRKLLNKISFTDDLTIDLINIDLEELYTNDARNLQRIKQPKNLAYVIYTSGSTGNPKGVLVEHRNVVSYIYAFNNEFELNENDRVLQQASYSFDASVEEIYPILTVGGSLVIFEKAEILDVKLLADVIFKHRITLLSSSPLLLNELNKLKPLNSIHTFISGGDVLKGEYINSLIKYAKVYNTYGPTESTVCATFHQCTEPLENNIPIGLVITNYQVHIFDKMNQLVPIGVAGELCISGAGVARGYLNRPDLTEEKFVINPFTGCRMYKTGDLARWRSDGNIEFLGRIDNQIKIRGYRIETGEIEDRLLKHSLIKDVIVVARKVQSDNLSLCAYFVSEEEISTSNLRNYLKRDLPEYMIPAYFSRLEEMPVTKTGKIDLNNLPKHTLTEIIDTESEYIEPVNEIEKKLSLIWSDILGVKKIGRNANFFTLGGHSLNATSLVTEIYKEFQIEIPLHQIFKTPLLKDIAEYISKAEKRSYSLIKPVDKNEYYQGYYPTSSAQKRLFILEQFEGINSTYNMPGMYRIEGKLDYVNFEDAIYSLVDRHESLRTFFESVNGEIVQKIKENVTISISYLKAKEGELERISKEFVKPFDLSHPPLFRVGLIECENSHFLLIDMHHIISDGVSMNILIEDFVKLYQGDEIFKLEIQYKDFAVWQNELFKSSQIQKQVDYWLEIFVETSDIPVLNLPMDCSIRPMVMNFEGDHYYHNLSKELTLKLYQLMKKYDVTLYMISLAVYNILLYKYTNQEDIIVGTPIAGRDYPGLEKIFGMFVNTLPVRNYPESKKSFAEFLNEVKENALGAYENQDYPFEMLIDKLDLHRDMSRNPLFDTVLVLQNKGQAELSIPGLTFKPCTIQNKVSRFDLTWNLEETGDEINITLEYSTKLFKKETVQRMIEHFENIIREVSLDSNLVISKIQMISESEKDYLLNHLNGTKAEYPKEKAIKEIFEEQVSLNSDQIALIFNDQSMTYGELNSRANQLARDLMEKGVSSNQIVGLLVERSFEMIIGILGIMKSGGAYLPIDPDYPIERIEYMLNDSATRLLLTDRQEFTNFNGEIISLNDHEIQLQDDSNLDKTISPNDLLYIIYTSGSTGKPKGVMIEHYNLHRLLFNDQMLFDFDKQDVWTMFHSYCFDFSVWEMWGALLYGGKLVIIPKLIAQNPAEYLEVLSEEKITILNQTPTAFYKLIDEVAKSKKDLNVRYIIFGGEALKPIRLQEWKDIYPETRLINMYGITETTVHVTYKEITEEEIKTNVSNIGKPIPTLTTYIMDKDLNLVATKVAGELCVGGDGLARGYLNRPQLTAEKFVKNPYKPEERIYRSGDLVRLMENGEKEYLGRIDHQVKIRGFRIELGEIENQLIKIENIKEAIVIDLKDDQGISFLAAYIVTLEEISLTELRDNLSKMLPDYMIPSYFVRLDHLPLTNNGKVNRKALPKPDGSIHSGKDYVAPARDIEIKLANIWSDVLGVERIGINDDFFELGGHSLKATNLIQKIRKELALEISLKEIFKNPGFKEQIKILENAKKAIYSSLKPVEKMNYYPVSAAQKRLFLFDQINSENMSYNIPVVLILQGELNRELFEKAVQKLIKRHESFRTSLKMIDKEVVQIIHPEVNIKISDLNVEEARIDEVINEFVRPFDLTKAPLLRVGLGNLDNGHLLIFDMHHIISDGTSMNILIQDFLELYVGKELKEVEVQYKDFAFWQNQFLESELIQKQEEYWMNLFAEGVPTLEIPTDFERPSVTTFEGAAIHFELDAELIESLYELANQNRATLFMVLLAGFNIFLSKYTGQEEIIVGTPIAGRNHPDLEEIIGMFVNTLALKNSPLSQKSVKEFIVEVRENTLKAYENQDYQFEMLVDKLGIHTKQNRTPLFDVMLVVQNMGLKEIETEDFKAIHYTPKTNLAKFDMTLYVVEGQTLKMTLNYKTKLFAKETMERFMERLIEIIREIVEYSTKTIIEIGRKPEEEVVAGFSDFIDDLEDEF